MNNYYVDDFYFCAPRDEELAVSVDRCCISLQEENVWVLAYYVIRGGVCR